VRGLRLALLVVGAAALAVPAVAPAADGDLVVRFAARADGGERATARRAAEVVRLRGLPVSGMEVVAPRPGVSSAAAAAALERSPAVLYAESDAARWAARIPNDPLFGQQWGLADIRAPAAWDRTVGDRAVTVAAVDTGIDLLHPDLSPNRWQNAGEAPNGLDDDGDGRIDDLNGWDFVAEDADPADPNGHGTHVAGTIAANGDDAVGAVGVSWRAGLMALRALDANGSGFVSDVIQAYAYAARHGARIVNVSFGGPQYSQADYDAIRASDNLLFVAAAGNEGADNDAVPTYPCSYGLPNVICVAAAGPDHALPFWSNRGRGSVDLAAPGVDVLSTLPSGAHAAASGTSAAAPHVAGAAALLLAANPGLTASQLAQALLRGAVATPALQGLVATGGRLDVTGALANVPPPAQPPPAAAPVPPASAPSSPAPQGVPAPTGPALRLTLRAPARARLHTLLAGRLRVRAGCSQRCSLRLRLEIDARSARRLGLTRGARTVAIAAATGRLAGSGTRTLTMRPTARAKRALVRTRRLQATLRATATGAAGHRDARSASLLLTRGRRRAR
jgi:subtilisin family serine protease